MRSLATSLLLATVVVGIAAAGAVWLQPSRPFPWWHLCVAPFWVPMILEMAIHGRAGSTSGNVLIFILTVAMWSVLIDAGRRLWRGWRSP